MSYGNPLLGTMKGKLGDVIFSRSRGRQQARAHVVSPANPKTLSQRGQRVKFGTASAFYRSAVKNLFKFAFEYKLQGESDYNAFMRYNLPDMACNTKSAYSRGLPCVSDWMLSNGTLQTPAYDYVGDPGENYPALLVNVSTDDLQDWSIGKLSHVLADMYDLRNGDIVTIVSIRSFEAPLQTIAEAKNALAQTTSQSYQASSWVIQQFVLDFKSVLPVASLGIFDLRHIVDGALVIDSTVRNNDHFASGFAVIFSRQTPRGLKVSTSRILLSEESRVCADFSKSEEWWKFCAQTFDATVSLANDPENILEGSIADISQYEEVPHDEPWPQQAKVSAVMGDTTPVNTIHLESGFNMREGIMIDVEGDTAKYAYTGWINNERVQQWEGTATDWKIGIGETSGSVYFIAPTNERVLNGIYYKG